MEEFCRVCMRRKLNVHVAKNKVMQSARNSIVEEMNIMMDTLALEEVEVFKFLCSLVTAVGGVEAEVHHRVFEEIKVLGAVSSEG